jgi:hypothetical protein
METERRRSLSRRQLREGQTMTAPRVVINIPYEGPIDLQIVGREADKSRLVDWINASDDRAILLIIAAAFARLDFREVDE